MDTDENCEGDEEAEEDEEEKHLVPEEIGVDMVEDEFGRGEGVGDNIDHVFGEGQESNSKTSQELFQNRRILHVQVESYSY